MMAADAKLRLIEEGSRLIHEKGYHHTGITEVLRAAGVPKGSFYFHFDSKEAFGLEVIDHYRGHFTGLARKHLENNSGPYLGRLEALFVEFESFFDAQCARLGCPVGNLASELADVNERFREKLATVFAEMRESLAAFLTAAQDAGEVAHSLDIAGMSQYLLLGWEGALTVMKTAGSIEPLQVFRRFSMAYLRGAES